MKKYQFLINVNDCIENLRLYIDTILLGFQLHTLSLNSVIFFYKSSCKKGLIPLCKEISPLEEVKNLLLCYFDIYFFKITNDLAGTDVTFELSFAIL